MSGNEIYLEVAVAAPIFHSLTYKGLPDCDPPLPGCRVLVPLGRRQVTGYILNNHATPDPSYKIRKITKLVDEIPLFPATMVEFFRWTADYYQYPLGEVIKTALPAGITASSGRKISLTDMGKEELAKLADHPEAPPWLETLMQKGTLTPGRVRQLWKVHKDRTTLEKWRQEQWVQIDNIVTGVTTGSRTVCCVILKDLSDNIPTDLKKSEQKTLTLLRELSGDTSKPVTRPQLAGKYSGARKALTSLAEKKLIELKEQPLYRDPFGEPPLFFPEPEQLSAEQQVVMAALQEPLLTKKYHPCLLHGVTSSGKTEVYLQAARQALENDRSVLVIVPEIALATQLEGHFISRFGDLVALLHSGLSKGERFDQWQRIARGEARIVIGARSAIFAPLENPGLIIVDEEHDGAYKQEDGLRYQGRDLAVLRASLAKCPIILGSATPSIISYQHAINGKYQLLTMTKRVEEKELPKVEVVDLQKIKTVSGRPPLFSNELVGALKNNLAQGDQSLIFLNRRGYASMMLCGDCGQVVRCPTCQISLTMHKGRRELLCHYCGHTTHSETICEQCRSSRIIPIGFGTEKLEEELTRMFPKARIARLDRDTGIHRRDFIATLRAVHNRQVDILVGTQMITKGHHFPHVTLVGVVWADGGLGIPDFRSGERTFQLLSQVTGRAGRGEKPGRVIIQSSNPDHYSIDTARNHDYRTLFDMEIELRRALKFPPFSRLINIRIEGTEAAEVQKTVQALKNKSRQLGKLTRTIEVLGPAPAPLARLHGRYRWQMLIKGSELKALRNFCRTLLASSEKNRPTSVKLSVDVDPENML